MLSFSLLNLRSEFIVSFFHQAFYTNHYFRDLFNYLVAKRQIINQFVLLLMIVLILSIIKLKTFYIKSLSLIAISPIFPHKHYHY